MQSLTQFINNLSMSNPMVWAGLAGVIMIVLGALLWGRARFLAPVVETPVAIAPSVAPIVAAPGFGIGALLAGLVLAAGLAAVLLSDNNNGQLPISPD